MDRFWAIVRRGAFALIGIFFGVTFFVILIHVKTNVMAPSLSYLGLVACGAGMLGNIILISKGTNKENKRTPAPKFIWMFFSWGGTTLLIMLPGEQRIMLPWLFATTLGCAFLALKLKQSIIFSGLLFVTIIGSSFWIQPPIEIMHFMLILVLLAVTSLIFHFLYRELTSAREEMSQLRREVGYLTQTNVRLQNHVMQEKELILEGERDRIAREFHDTIGHTLTGLVVKLQAIQSLVRIDPERAIEEIDCSCDLVREALREARLAVSALRDPVSKVLRGRALWTNLCETFAKCTGITIHTDCEEEFENIDDVVNAVVYRFIQEALTNAFRHGEATLIDVAVWWRDNELLARVSDNGHGVKTLNEGFGITGIRERVTELKGQVGWRSEYGKGFDIAIIIPCSRGDLN